MPFDELVGIVARLQGWWVLPAAAALGALAGLVLAFIAVAESLVVTVTDAAVRFTRGEDVRDLPRGDIADVFLDGKRLVLLDREGGELAREKHDLRRRRLADAFRAHGYPWRDGGDPYAASFRRFVSGIDGLPPGADAVLRARQKAIEREDGTKQYWRALPG